MLQIDIEQTPKGLPLPIQERDFKSHEVGVVQNLTHRLLLAESFRTPMFLRKVTWNSAFRSLKGINESIFVNLGGLLCVVSPLAAARDGTIASDVCVPLRLQYVAARAYLHS